MKKHVQHIAYLLLLFIAYPFIFQTLHILYNDHGHTHSHCRADQHSYIKFCSSVNGCGHSSKNTNHAAGSNHPEQHYVNIHDQFAGEADHCAICEHEFAKFSISKIFNICFTSEIFSALTPFPYRNPLVSFNGNNVSLRAPPPVSGT